jgi:hypothetical protein
MCPRVQDVIAECQIATILIISHCMASGKHGCHCKWRITCELSNVTTQNKVTWQTVTNYEFCASRTNSSLLYVTRYHYCTLLDQRAAQFVTTVLPPACTQSFPLASKKWLAMWWYRRSGLWTRRINSNQSNQQLGQRWLGCFLTSSLIWGTRAAIWSVGILTTTGVHQRWTSGRIWFIETETDCTLNIRSAP